MTRLLLSPPHMGGDELSLVTEVFASNWIAPTGPMVDRFEQDLAQLSGVPHVAALASGTGALHLALHLAGVAAGDQVWSSTMTFIGGVAPLRYIGAEPVFVDIDDDMFLLDLDLLEDGLERAATAGKLPKAVITTDLYGHVVDGARVRALADRFGFAWISDAAEALGASRDGRHAGHSADFAIFSFNGNKIITTSGGGAVASANAEMIAKARFLSTQARDPAPHYQHSQIGYNYRLSNVCAAIGVGQLRVLPERVRQRRAIHAHYRALLEQVPGVRFSGEVAGMIANRWLTTVQFDPAVTSVTSDTVRLALDAAGIEARPLWKPMHLQPVFAGAKTIGGARAERCFAQGLCLPSGSAMNADDVARVASVIVETLRSA